MNPAKIKKILAISAISCLMVFAINSTASAAFEYKMLEGLPGFYQKGADMPDLPDLILSIYKFGIWTVGIAGILMITVGGVMYMGSAGNNATAQSAKKIITDSLIGIVAALTAYLFLYVINPDLVKINLSNLIKIEITEDSETGGTVEADKGSAGSTTTSGGCAGIVEAARKAKSEGWTYYPEGKSSSYRGKTVSGVRYTDCSDFTESVYKAAGCSSPGSGTIGMYPKATSFISKSELKAGDAVIRRSGTKGHVVVCMDDGCTQIIHSPTHGKQITIKNSSYYTSQTGDWANAKVIKASTYCKSC